MNTRKIIDLWSSMSTNPNRNLVNHRGSGYENRGGATFVSERLEKDFIR